MEFQWQIMNSCTVPGKKLTNALFDTVTKNGQTSFREGFTVVTGAALHSFVDITGSDTGSVYVPHTDSIFPMFCCFQYKFTLLGFPRWHLIFFSYSSYLHHRKRVGPYVVPSPFRSVAFTVLQ